MFRKAIPLALALFALADLPLCAQEYSFRSFGDPEGLSNLTIRKIYQDHTGFLWVSTENGIYRYDGDRFELFGPAKGIPSSFESAFGEAPDGSLLAGGSFGLYRLAGNRFEKVATPFKTVSGLQSIQSDGKGHTFVGTDAGLVELDSSPAKADFVFRIFPQPQGTSGPQAYGILVDGDVLWYGCGMELCRNDAQGTRVFARDRGLPALPVLGILKDPAGNLFVTVRGDGIFVWPAGKARFERPRLPVPPAIIRAVPVLDHDGRILLPSPEGLLLRDENGWQNINHSFGLRGLINAAFEDRQHTLWIGSGGRGLVIWRGYREWESYSTESGLAAEIVYGILPLSDGSLWVGTGSGLFQRRQRKSSVAFTLVPGFAGTVVHSLASAPNGDIWVGSEGRGVARIEPPPHTPTWFGEAEGLSGRNIYRLRFDHENRLWAATEAGLFMASAPYRRFSRIADLPATRMWGVVQGTDGTVWAGGDSGLFALQAGHWKAFTLADGLSNREILSLGAGPDGDIWVGYDFGGGIDRVHPRAGGVAVERSVQRKGTDGMIYFLEFDARGRLWAGTQHGVDIWDGARWTHYDMNDGLVWDDCDTDGFAQGPDGAIWIGTSAGLSRFKPLPHPPPDVPLAVVFTRLAIGQTDVSSLRNPSFGVHSNSLVARYSALNAPRANGVVFRYRLGGATGSWTETAQREIQFANLAPGTYSLEIEAREGDGLWTDQSARFLFTVLTPWYSTWWFATLCLFVPISVAAGALRLRFLSAQRRERHLLKLVEEKTTDLRRANEELSRLSFTDPLTGLANRRVFDQTLDRECARLQRTDSALSLLSIDVDHFKALNDSEGHQRGDECLILLGAEFTRLCRRQLDLVARCGGEEFAVVLVATPAPDAQRFADSVCQAIADMRLPNPASPVAPWLTISIGVATATHDSLCSPEALTAAADRALYAAKRAGRNRVSVAGPEGDVEQSTIPSVVARP
ncbi:MAG TPA: diguanylate cyclase [Terracidiphilus sp.]|nr:diguanylate cyclase [Terracidiphilus sp.]